VVEDQDLPGNVNPGQVANVDQYDTGVHWLGRADLEGHIGGIVVGQGLLKGVEKIDAEGQLLHGHQHQKNSDQPKKIVPPKKFEKPAHRSVKVGGWQDRFRVLKMAGLKVGKNSKVGTKISNP